MTNSADSVIRTKGSLCTGTGSLDDAVPGQLSWYSENEPLPAHALKLANPGVPNGFGLVQGVANAIAGGKRPLSSMSPTILLKDGKPYMVTGSPGGSTIITTVTQSIINVVDFGMNMQAAVDAPRFHHQWLPDQIMVEPGYLTPATRATLESMGHAFREVPSWGADEAILIDPKTGALQGATDRRRPAGLAAGY